MKINSVTSLLTVAAFLVLSIFPVHAAEDSVSFDHNKGYWFFQNGSSNLGSRNFLLETDKKVLMDNLQNTEKYTANRILQFVSGGACNGMSVTAILASYDIITPTLLGHPYASDLSSVGVMDIDDFQLTDTAKSAINYYQVIQAADAARQHSAWMMYHKTSEERLQYLLSCVEDGSPTLLMYSGFFRQESRSLHCVVAYRMEYGSWEYDGKEYDGRVLIYDPNTIILYDDTCLYFNTEDWSWTIPGSNSDSNTCALTNITDDIELINHAGLIKGTQYISEEPFLGVLVTNELMSDYTVSKAGMADQGWVYTNEPNHSMKEFDGFYIDAIDSAAVNFVTPDIESGYALDLKAPQELETAMYYENSIQYIYATDGSQVVFTPDGYAAISGMDTDYTLEMVFNEDHYQGSWYDFSVSGTADTASLQKTEDGYILKSDNLRNITVAAKNDTAQANLTFSTDADSVLLCEENESTIAAKIDTDGDGVYETELSTEPDSSVYGDINGDGSVNALDAALILQYAAYAGAGGEVSLSEYIASL